MTRLAIALMLVSVASVLVPEVVHSPVVQALLGSVVDAVARRATRQQAPATGAGQRVMTPADCALVASLFTVSDNKGNRFVFTSCEPGGGDWPSVLFPPPHSTYRTSQELGRIGR